MTVEPLGQLHLDSLAATVGLHTDHRDDLAPSCHQPIEVSLWARGEVASVASHAHRKERSPRHRAYRSLRGGPSLWRNRGSGKD